MQGLANQNNNYIEEIIEKYSDMVYRIALTRVKNKEEAEDIFQEVFLKFSKKLPEFQSKEHEKAWFIKVTINLSKNTLKSAWKRKVQSLDDDNIEFENKENQDIFYEVQSLPQKYRTVIYLYYYEGYKVKEIAMFLKTKEGTIKTWLSRARDTLKNNLQGGFNDE